jgi:low temperature requirement protein LtrA
VPAALLFLRGVDGWRLHPGHFAERHGLIVIIAIGESIVAAGVGVAGQELDAQLIVASVLAIAVAAALWWTYFDIGFHVAERRLTTLEGAERARMARDSYTYLHLPMVAGIILFALGVKKTLEHVDEPLATVPAVALCGGLAVYFAGQVAFRVRNVRSFSRRRSMLVIVLCALIPVATEIDALLALAATAVAAWGMITYEVLRYREARQRMRHPQEVPA